MKEKIARTVFSITNLFAADEVKRQENIFPRVEHELEKRFHAAFLNKMREKRWKEKLTA